MLVPISFYWLHPFCGARPSHLFWSAAHPMRASPVAPRFSIKRQRGCVLVNVCFGKSPVVGRTSPSNMFNCPGTLPLAQHVDQLWNVSRAALSSSRSACDGFLVHSRTLVLVPQASEQPSASKSLLQHGQCRNASSGGSSKTN